jgi:hypothetical protein
MKERKMNYSMFLEKLTSALKVYKMNDFESQDSIIDSPRHSEDITSLITSTIQTVASSLTTMNNTIESLSKSSNENYDRASLILTNVKLIGTDLRNLMYPSELSSNSFGSMYMSDKVCLKSLQELKSDLRSLKGMVLSRRNI